MNYINLIFIIFYIYVAIKYYKALKKTQDMLKDNIQDYFELKAQNAKLECFINDLYNEIKKLKDLHNAK